MLDVKLKGLPNEDIVQGYPGVAATWPRVLATIEIRAAPRKEREPRQIAVGSVSVGLYRTDIITLPSKGINSSRREQSFLVTKQKVIWKASEGKGAAGYGLDVPFVLSLPTNRAIPASISLGKAVETTYHLFVTVSDYDGASEHYKFPVKIKRFDTLSTFGTFQAPVTSEVPSSDHLVDLEYSLPTTCFGPRDTITMLLRAVSNQDWAKSKKVRLKRFSIELVQITRFTPSELASDQASQGSDGASSSKASQASSGTGDTSTAAVEEDRERRQRICKASKDFNPPAELGANALGLELEIPSGELEDADHIAPKDLPEIPREGRTGFTTSTSLYSIDYILVVKARFSHAKDIETQLPVTISEFDHASCMVYMSNIIEAAHLARYTDRRTNAPEVHRRPLDTTINIM